MRGAVLLCLNSRSESDWPVMWTLIWIMEHQVFLLGLAAAAVACCAVLTVTEWKRRGPEAIDQVRLDVYETAALSGGPEAVFYAGLKYLVGRGILAHQGLGRLSVKGSAEDDLHWVEEAILKEAVALGHGPQNVHTIAARVYGRLGRLFHRLRDDGLVLTFPGVVVLRVVPCAVVGGFTFYCSAVAAECGSLAVCLGILVGLVFWGVPWAAVLGPPWRTLLGEQLLQRARKREDDLLRRHRESAGTLTAEEIRLAVALLGARYPEPDVAL